MKTSAPPDRRKFKDDRDQLDYLYHKLLYWLYERADKFRARSFAKRLATVLSVASPGHDAIFPEECRSLICEANDDLPAAIKHRENEIRLMKRLRDISRSSPQHEEVGRLYSHEDLCDRLDLLAVLYHDSGHLDEAIGTLIESNKLCQKHGLEFDGDDILKEYLQEKSRVVQEENRTGTHG